MELVFHGYGDYDKIAVYVDANWADCMKTRNSTNGGMITFGNACLKFWSSIQTTTPLSSGESELYAVVKGTAECIGMRILM